MIDLAEGLVGWQSRGCIMAMLQGSGPGSTLGSQAGVIKPGGVLLAVLLGVLWAMGPSKSHTLTGYKEQSINRSCLILGVTMASCLLEACQEQQGAEVCMPAYMSTRLPLSTESG